MEISYFTQPITDNFLVDIIAWLIKISSSIAVGVILFTVALKLVTLPFDYISRASMRKNSLKMEQMRPELEKLQEQYANDKQLYQQKMMALYKKNGYSMLGSCLPTILTLVIFIIAINAFTNFSQYQNKMYFYNMSKAYNNVVYAGFELDEGETKYITRGRDYIPGSVEGELIIKGEDLYELYLADADGVADVETVTVNKDTDKQFDITVVAKDVLDTNSNPIVAELKDDNNVVIGHSYTKKLLVSTTNSYVSAALDFNENVYLDQRANEVFFSTRNFSVIEEKLTDSKLASLENNNLKMQLLDEEGNFVLDENGNKVEKTFSEAKAENPALTAEAFLLDISQQKAAEVYREEQAGFLWVKNIWVTDSPFSHPVEENWSEFMQTHEYDGFDIGSSGYDNLTKKLVYEKNAPNGYFILVVLTAGSSLLMQLIMSKSQKAQMELQTVDGKGKQTQKIMTIVMPIMMAIFAFMYTSAFSIYIILSSTISMGTTLAINKFVDHRFKKQVEKKEGKDKTKVRGRIYTPKKEEVKEEPKKAKKGKQDALEHGDKDFLSGKADGKKRVRGRLK